MLNHKAQLAEGAIFWIFYIFLTGMLIYFVVSTPATVFSRATQTNDIENAIFSDRAYAKIGWKSDLTGRVYEGVLPTMAFFDSSRITNAFDTAGTPRRLAMKLTLGGKTVYFHENDYRDWEPLSPVRYKKFTEIRPVFVIDSNKLDSVTIEQLFSPKPAGVFS